LGRLSDRGGFDVCIFQTKEVAVKPILILTAAFGEGHNAAARNLKDGLLAVDPTLTVEVHDVFQEAYGPANELARRGYLATINHAPALWSLCFWLLDSTPIVEWHIGLYGAAIRRLENLLSTLRPGLVVSTYPGCNHLLETIGRRRLRRPFKIVTVITDSITVNSAWYKPHSDAFVVPNDITARGLIDRGLPQDKIQALGFPVPTVFDSCSRLEKSAPSGGEPWKVLYMVNSGEHLASHILRELLPIPGIELTVTTGKNEKLAEVLSAQAQEAGVPIRMLGWTPDMPRWIAESHFLIGKAGGATVQECLAAATPMIITQIIPGQEEGNARLVLDSGAGLFGPSASAIASHLRSAIADDGRLWKDLTASARSLGHPDASRQVANFLLHFQQ
jgi:processive 1,2-diacylglycerol beta-glucosyltransferase